MHCLTFLINRLHEDDCRQRGLRGGEGVPLRATAVYFRLKAVGGDECPTPEKLRCNKTSVPSSAQDQVPPPCKQLGHFPKKNKNTLHIII